MSHDDIVFGDVKLREPERRRRPDRDRRFACLAYEVPGPDDLPIFLDRLPADAIERHALRDTSVELGGILLGKECLDDQTGAPFVWITQALEAKHYENTQASFTYTHDSWEEITRERDQQFPDLDIVGWYHTHPDFGVFLSGHDLFIQRHFFDQPLQVAYVVDPIRQTRAFFQWRAGKLAEVGGFHLTADRTDRAGLTRLVNDLENVPNTEGGGGGLSPRLEAQLIAMLTRPASHHAPASPAERAQTAVLFSMLGLMIGILGFAGVLWLNALGTRISDQSQALDDLKQTLDRSAAAHRLVVETFQVEGKELSTAKFLEQFDRLARDRDALRQRIDNQQVVNDALATRAKDMQRSVEELTTDLTKAKKHAAANELDAGETVKLRDRFATLAETSDEQSKKLEKLQKLLDATDEKNAEALLRKTERTWWVATAGWSLCAVLGLGLLATLANRKEGDPGPGPPPGPRSEEPPTIRIT